MKAAFKGAIASAIVSSLAIASMAVAARADGTRAIGVVAVSYVGTRIDSVSSAIAVGKNSAAGTASINGTETAASAIGSAGLLTVTNPNTTSVGYQIGAESATELGTPATTTPVSTKQTVDNLDGQPKAVTIVIP
ncbi:hypothetical protein [Chamaesiphon polymorphus]|uniref:Uncharacterized protein n=1 Tax=Chamaesiphon polymorphus CCALA 037 TaxID=2107692 RepID=A0A2T1GFE3_9CYAN|nr:hypothetical protein [Chamaesiphon polymorphus]PSB56262.1 hypothetical protein C7B77_12475 [Chamaesiphon polymorphus CCALA 037]